MFASIPKHAWKRRFDAKDPDENVHSPAVPPLLDIIRLLPVAYRVGTHILHERRHKREPIFDLNGIALQPPHPGPHAGAPLGGLGCGSIGRGFKGEFRRWSLYPGKYIHKAIVSDVFSVRVNRKGKIESVVLSVVPPDENSCLTNWNWRLPMNCGTYHAVFPRAWTVYEDPLPNIRVIIKQVSPFIPSNYSDSSLPAAVFEVEVENKSTTEEIDVSVLFCFQNGLDSDCLHERQLKGFYHHSFATENSGRTLDLNDLKGRCPSARGVSMHHESIRTYSTRPSHSVDIPETDVDVIYNSKEIVEENREENKTFSDKVSIAIAGRKESNNVVSTCAQFITRPEIIHNPNLFDCSGNTMEDYSKESRTAEELWLEFHNTGDISDRIYIFPEENNGHSTRPSIVNNNLLFPQTRPLSERRYGSAVCIRQTLARASIAKATSAENGKDEKPLHCGVFTFSLAWDYPLARFGGGKALPRFYTRFFGNDGSNAQTIATYALWKASIWESQIIDWQEKIYNSFVLTEQLDNDETALVHHLPLSCDYFQSQLFNELYYLVDGGTQWLDSCNGRSNQVLVRNVEVTDTTEGEISSSTLTTKESVEESHQSLHKSDLVTGMTSKGLQERLLLSPTSSQHVVKETTPNPRKLLEHARILFHTLQTIEHQLQQHEQQVQGCTGNQSLIGQFLYLEGHEYLMYNTYDVHFYASFALLMLWPELELSLQKDVAISVLREDHTERQMMGEGDYCIRKKKGAVPHDVGSPSEEPWSYCNAYNFQDVSRWKDLGSKFILQMYRNIYYLSQIAGPSSHTTSDINTTINTVFPLTPKLFDYLQELFPILLQVMQGMEQQFDLDHDGMIENSGFPDQTYDIWIAKGIQAYCGGLWITACEAMVKICELLRIHHPSSDENHQNITITISNVITPLSDLSLYYAQLANKARQVYIKALWNGIYLNYDSSQSGHHDSIMADMLAGQWYARVCDLPPPISAGHAFSCLKTIYDHNVIAFGKGQFMGAVNGMRPEKMEIDQSCIQSREVWTGTTYGLAAVMLQEAFHQQQQEQQEEEMGDTEGGKTTTEIGAIGSEFLSTEQRKELVQMAYTTAQGIHDAGWQRYGYWFATPEAWEVTGQYRSLGYMRALCIWSMEYAREQAMAKRKSTAKK